jgi:two-component system nitrogen regulation response regulator GlnG
MHLPPLRERKEDVIELAQAFLAKVSKNAKTLSGQAENSLTGRAWPGNVRELQNTIERASLMAKSDRVCPEDIEWTADKVPQGDANSAMEDAISRALAIYFGKQEGSPLAPDLYPQILGSLERPLLRQIMAMAAGNQLKAARMLGINRNTLHKKLLQYRLLS